MTSDSEEAEYDYLYNPVTGLQCPIALEIPLILANPDGTYTMELDLQLGPDLLDAFTLEHGVRAEVIQRGGIYSLYATGTFNAIRSTHHKLYAVSLPYFDGEK